MVAFANILCALFVAVVYNKTVVGGFLPNLDCNPRLAVVQTNQDTSFNYYPYYVSLHRCGGSNGVMSPFLVKCIPDQVTELKVHVLTAERSKDKVLETRAMSLTMVNHTSCKTECVLKKEECKQPNVYDENSCKCICNLGVIGPRGMQCSDQRKIWSSVRCGCTCRNTKKCESRREYFDQDSCSCKCKRRKLALKGCEYYGDNYNPATCSCVKRSRSVKATSDAQMRNGSILFWISAAAIECLVMICAFEIFLYKMGSGLVFSVKSKVLKKREARKFEQDVDDEDEEKEQAKCQMTYREMLRLQARRSVRIRSSRNSSIRSSRNSSIHPGPQTPLITSPIHDNIAEDVFFNE